MLPFDPADGVTVCVVVVGNSVTVTLPLLQTVNTASEVQESTRQIEQDIFMDHLRDQDRIAAGPLDERDRLCEWPTPPAEIVQRMEGRPFSFVRGRP
jgi:hypothetical protein